MKITKISEQFGDYLYHRLPKVYRDYDVAINRKVKLTDGTEKVKQFYTLQEYLYSFAEGGFQPLLEDLEAIINLIDPMSCPEQFLPVLLQHFGLDFIEDIPVKFQRRLVQNIVTLYKKKGTIPAVAFLARELSGFDVTIEETERGNVEFALIKLNAYENEAAELLLAQEVVQRYIHLFLPTQAKAEIIVTYGFTEGIHINSSVSLEEYEAQDIAISGSEYDHIRYDVDEYDDEHAGFVWEEYFYDIPELLERCVEEDFDVIRISHEFADTESEDFDFYPFDISSLTNVMEEGDFVYTNGTCCEDTITTAVHSDEDGDGTVEFTYPNETRATIAKLGGNSVKGVFPVAKITTSVMAGDWIRLEYKGNYYYWQCNKNLHGSTDYPITLILCVNTQTVKVFCWYERIRIGENAIITKNTGYDSFRYALDTRVMSSSYLTEDKYKLINCSISTEGYYGTTTETMYARISQTYVDIAYGGITTVEDMLTHLESNPITIYAPVSADGCYGTYMEKYLETDNIPSSYNLSVVCEVVTNPNKLSSYPSVSFMRSTKVAVTDDDGFTKTYDIPLELLSLNGKHDYIEKVGDKYYHHHWVDKLNIKDFTNSSFLGSSADMLRIYVPEVEGYPYYPIDTSDMRNNLYCDFEVITPDTVSTRGSDRYEIRYFKTSGWLTKRVVYINVHMNIEISLYKPKLTGTISCEKGKTLTFKIINTTDNKVLENKTVTHSDGNVSISHTLPSLLQNKVYTISFVCVNDSDGVQILNCSTTLDCGLIIKGSSKINTSNNSDVDIRVMSVGNDLLDEHKVISGTGSMELEVPNILISAMGEVTVVGCENVQVESTDDSTHNEYVIQSCNGVFMTKLDTTDVTALKQASSLNWRDWKRFIKDSDIAPNFYYVRSEERVEEISDKVVLNKLNLLPIPDIYAKIYSKDIPFSEIEVSVESKMYY